jgi:uncharacterized membrane protein YdjX (TVP38/TMEM64 family)
MPPQPTQSAFIKYWKPVVLLLLVIAVLIAAQWAGVGSWLNQIQQTIKNAGSWAPLLFIVIYIGLTVAAVPGTPLTVAAGALFGTVLGIVYVSIASTVGAALCFLIARYFARGAAAEWLAKKKNFQKLDQMIKDHGDIIVALTRLVPLFPYNLLNYGFGLTKVAFWTYVFWTWLCMLPGTFLYVAGADAMMVALTEGKMPWLLLGFIAIVLLILIVLIQKARKILREKETQTEQKADTNGA